jgi:hypothetical protein
MDDLNAAKKRMTKNMRKNSKNEVPYAMPVSDSALLDDFTDGLTFINSEMYDVVTGLTVDQTSITFQSKFGPILHRISTLGKQASNLNFSEYTVYEINEIKQLRNSIETNNGNVTQILEGKRPSATLDALNQLTTQVNSLLRFIDLKIQQPFNLGPLQGGFLLPRHLK